MSQTVKIEVKDENVQDLLKKLLTKINNLSPIMMPISETMQKAVQINFATEGKNLPTKWPPHATATVKQRTKKKTWPGKILQESRALFDSISSGYDSNSAWTGVNRPYAAIHQFGGMAGRGKKVSIPARPYLALTDYDKQKIRKLLEKFLEKF